MVLSRALFWLERLQSVRVNLKIYRAICLIDGKKPVHKRRLRCLRKLRVPAISCKKSICGGQQGNSNKEPENWIFKIHNFGKADSSIVGQCSSFNVRTRSKASRPMITGDDKPEKASHLVANLSHSHPPIGHVSRIHECIRMLQKRHTWWFQWNDFTSTLSQTLKSL